MSRIRTRTGWTLVVLSLLLHLFTVFCYARQSDHFAAFTVLPIWIWGGAGLFLSCAAFYFLRAPLSLVMTSVWAVTLLVGADEAKVLANLGKTKPLPGPAAAHDGMPVLRAITMNCAVFKFGNPAKDLAVWNPDIVLLQDALPHQVKQIADVLYDGHGDYREHQTNGIVTRWKIQREIRNPLQRNQQATILMLDGRTLEIVNLHLSTAATDLRFWNRATWTAHRVNRVLRRDELAIALEVFRKTTAQTNTPTLLGGDFNAPATDAVHSMLTPGFTDAFARAGTGWGNTFQRRCPIIRIDCLYATPHLTPVRSIAVTTRNSDHRMVIADFVFR